METLISVIITCYNHGRYLPDAIESVLAQSYQHVEIVVVDDGSTDNTKAVAENYPAVKYVFQTNQGLSAARNTGIENSAGSYLVFLDADDWLLPGALLVNLQYLRDHTKAAFVSGEHLKVNQDKEIIKSAVKEPVSENHYCHLLIANYIEMHAAVMYQRWVFKQFRYDTNLSACEDYDLYLKIARAYPILHHGQLIAAYRHHDSNMSKNIPLILESALQVLDKQHHLIRNNEEKLCLLKGKRHWKNIYCSILHYQLLTSTPGTKEERRKEVMTLRKHHKAFYFTYCATKALRPLKEVIKNNLPRTVSKWLFKIGIYKSFRSS